MAELRISLSGCVCHERADHTPVISSRQWGRGVVGKSNDRSYRLKLVPITSGREDTHGIEREHVLSGERTMGVTRRYLVGRETTWVLAWQSVRFKVEVDFVRTKKIEVIICRV